MAALPKRKPSTHRQGRRRASQRLTLPKLVKCPRCGALKLPHLPCPQCGWHGEKTKGSPPPTASPAR